MFKDHCPEARDYVKMWNKMYDERAAFPFFILKMKETTCYEAPTRKSIFYLNSYKMVYLHWITKPINHLHKKKKWDCTWVRGILRRDFFSLSVSGLDSFLCISVIFAVFYLFIRLVGCSVGPRISRGARKLTRTLQVIKKK
jgi:hypothetical protein